jgi:hypothetical protein
MTATARIFPFYRVVGTHRAIGRQFGEACGELIERHRDLALARLGKNKGLTPASALAAAARYRGYVLDHAPFLDEEVQGVAEGAKIPLAEAYLLQLRAEVAAPTPPTGATNAPPTPSSPGRRATACRSSGRTPISPRSTRRSA